jgi:hypothetical protein
VRFDRVQRLKDRGDATLGIPGVGLIDGILGEQQDFRARLRRRDGGAKTGHAPADHQHVRYLLRQTRSAKRDQVAALSQGLKHSTSV